MKASVEKPACIQVEMRPNDTLPRQIGRGGQIGAAAVLLAAMVLTGGGGPDTSWPRNDMRATGKHGVVVTQEPHATAVGLEVLRKGGNAVDAAVAVALTLAVTFPQAGNLGGGDSWCPPA